jgi:hypothetical protein
MVELLLAHGADVTLASKAGQTPLALAVGGQPGVGAARGLPSVGERAVRPAPPSDPRLEIVDLLRQHGAKESVVRSRTAGRA